MDFCIDGVELKKYTGNDKEVFVPEEVRILGENCFANRKDIEIVNIGPKVRIISENAFYGCENLKTVNTFGRITIIGDGAFWGCKSFENIDFKGKVLFIGDNAFAGCESLHGITIPEGIYSIGKCAFAGCKSLGNMIIPEGIKEIQTMTFAGCVNLKNIVFPKTLKTIMVDAFYNCTRLIKIMILKELGNEKVAFGLEKYIKKFEKYKSLSDAIVDLCFNDICANGKVCDLMLKINSKEYDKYEMETEIFTLQQAKDITTLWENVLEQENGLYNYVNEVVEGEAILLFLYRKEDLSKAIATIEIGNGKIERFIYTEREEIAIEVKEWLEDYVWEKKLSISGTEYVLSQIQKRITPEHILKAVSEYFSLSKEDLVEKKGNLHAKAIAIYLCRKILNAPFPIIGKMFNGRDNAFVINQFYVIDEAVSSGEKLIKRELYDIQNVIGVKWW